MTGSTKGPSNPSDTVNNIVQSAAGTADLTAGAVAGQRYAVVVGGGLDLFDELDAAYLGATDAAITLTPPAIDFALVGTDLSATQIRTLIISNISNGVVAYQAFEVTFNPAP